MSQLSSQKSITAQTWLHSVNLTHWQLQIKIKSFICTQNFESVSFNDFVLIYLQVSQFQSTNIKAASTLKVWIHTQDLSSSFFVLWKKIFWSFDKTCFGMKVKKYILRPKNFFFCVLFSDTIVLALKLPTLIEKTEVERDFAISWLSKDFRQSLLPCKEFGEALNWVWKECILKMG